MTEIAGQARNDGVIHSLSPYLPYFKDGKIFSTSECGLGIT